MSQPNEKSYLLEKIPAELYAKAQTKCRTSNPPVSLKWVLLSLLKGWVRGDIKAK